MANGDRAETRSRGKQRLINGHLVTVSRQFMRCGKPNCICHSNPEKRHGPYWKGFYREAGRLKSMYIGKQLPEEVRVEG